MYSTQGQPAGATQYMNQSGNAFDYVNRIAGTPASLRKPWEQEALANAQATGANVAVGNQYADSSGNSWDYIDRIANTPQQNRKPWEVDALGQANSLGADIAYPTNHTQGLWEISQSAERPDYTPAQVPGVAPVQSGQIATTDMSQYMNPYTQQVTDIALQDLGRQNDILQNNMDAQTMAAGAFGGSRHGVAQAETNRAYLDQVARTTAGLNSDAFNTGLNSAQFDIGAQFNADAFNTGNQMQTQFANQNALNQGSQFNANQGLQNAQFQAGLQNLGFGQQQQVNSNIASQGALMQAQQQALIDAAQGQYQGWANSPQQSLATMLAAIGGVPAPVSSETSSEPGILDILGGII